MPQITPTEQPNTTLLSTGTHTKLIKLMSGQNLYPSFIMGHVLSLQSLATALHGYCLPCWDALTYAM